MYRKTYKVRRHFVKNGPRSFLFFLIIFFFFFPSMYKRDALPGGHVIMLGKGCQEAAIAAIRWVGGGLGCVGLGVVGSGWV